MIKVSDSKTSKNHSLGFQILLSLPLFMHAKYLYKSTGKFSYQHCIYSGCAWLRLLHFTFYLLTPSKTFILQLVRWRYFITLIYHTKVVIWSRSVGDIFTGWRPLSRSDKWRNGQLYSRWATHDLPKRMS